MESKDYGVGQTADGPADDMHADSMMQPQADLLANSMMKPQGQPQMNKEKKVHDNNYDVVQFYKRNSRRTVCFINTAFRTSKACMMNKSRSLRPPSSTNERNFRLG